MAACSPRCSGAARAPSEAVRREIDLVARARPHVRGRRRAGRRRAPAAPTRSTWRCPGAQRSRWRGDRGRRAAHPPAPRHPARHHRAVVDQAVERGEPIAGLTASEATSTGGSASASPPASRRCRSTAGACGWPRRGRRRAPAGPPRRAGAAAPRDRRRGRRAAARAVGAELAAHAGRAQPQRRVLGRDRPRPRGGPRRGQRPLRRRPRGRGRRARRRRRLPAEGGTRSSGGDDVAAHRGRGRRLATRSRRRCCATCSTSTW